MLGGRFFCRERRLGEQCLPPQTPRLQLVDNGAVVTKARGLFVLAVFLGFCFLSMLGFDWVFRVIAEAAGWRSAIATSTGWSASGETAVFVAQDGATYRIMLPAGKYSSYVESSKKHEIIYNTRNPSSWFLPNVERVLTFLFFFFFYAWLGGRIYARYRRMPRWLRGGNDTGSI